MRRRLYLLVGCYLAFYYLIHLVYDMPNLVHGNSTFELLPDTLRACIARLNDIAFHFLFVLIPYLALHHWYPDRKFMQVVGVVLVVVPVIFLLRFWAEKTGTRLRLRSYFLNNIFYTSISLIVGIVFYFIRYAHYRELQQKELELQHRQSELSFLRSQINPHFLFNSLNNIYSLVYHGSDQSLTAIAGLSDLLRYMLYDASEKVALQKEMDYIKQYISLQKLRFDHPIPAEVRIEGDLTGIGIEPLLLIPFVENAFKHGDFGPGGGLVVYLRQKGPRTTLYCSNRKGNFQKDAGGGIGLDNVRRRLSLLYPGRHTLTIEDGPVHFNVNLELNHV